MVKLKKIFGVAFAFLFTAFTFLGYGTAKAAAAPIIPQVKFVNTPGTEYTVGDRVTFDISAPNYGKKVEYRVILWDDSTKTAVDLWNETNGYPNRYYTKWQPWGNNVFTLGWPISKPGSYRITVYVKRVGIANDKAFLKGQNCDDYEESVAFVVKPKLTILDKDGQVYGSEDAAKPLAVKDDVNITANNVTLNNVNVEGNINITGDNSTLKNVIVTGKIVLNPGKDGSASLDNVTAKAIEVLSGGKESIHIKNVKTESLNVNSTSQVRVEADGDTEIVSTTANGYVIFDKKSGTFGTITISKTTEGENVIEFRGEIQDKVVVEAEATIKTTEGSKLENLVVAPESTDSKVVLQGTFTNVEVNKPAVVDIAAGTTVTAVEVKAAAEVAVAKGAEVKTLDTNNNTVVVDNQGTITNQENTGGTETPSGSIGGGGGIYVPPAEITNENRDFNTALNRIISDLNSYSLTNSVFGTIGSLPAYGRTNTLTLNFNTPYSTMNFGNITTAVRDRIIAHGAVSEQRDLNTLSHISSLLDNVTVNGTAFKPLASSKLISIGKPRTAAFIVSMNSTSYNLLYDALNEDPTLGSYENVMAVLHALMPGDDVTVNNLTVYGLPVQTVQVAGSTIYNQAGTGADKILTFGEITSALGLGISDETVKAAAPAALDGKSIVVTLRGTSGTVYTYTINF